MAKINRIVVEYLRQRVYSTVLAESIEQGDMLIKNADGSVSRASKLSTAALVRASFAGIAAQTKIAGQAKDLVVGVDVIADMDIASGTYSGVNGDAVETYVTGGAASDDRVIVASSAPIGKLAHALTVKDTVARVHFVGKDAIPVQVTVT